MWSLHFQLDGEYLISTSLLKGPKDFFLKKQDNFIQCKLIIQKDTLSIKIGSGFMSVLKDPKNFFKGPCHLATRTPVPASQSAILPGKKARFISFLNIFML